MSKVSTNKFNFFIPIDLQKAQDGNGNEVVKIKGIASTDAKDSDEEILIPSGFDFQPLLKTGFLNWNHQARTSSKAIVGEPTAAKVINNGKDFYIEGIIYPNEEGKNIVNLAQTLQLYSPNRRLGFSIEGQAIERDIMNPKRVTKARITGVAITQSPKNPNTLMDIVKGEYDEQYQDDDEDINDEDKKIEDEQKKLKKNKPSDNQVDKAMSVNIDINPESVEQKNREEKLPRILKKSDIYDKIRRDYTKDFQKAQLIYSFVQKIKDEHMKVDELTTEQLQKALNILDELTLVKSQQCDDNDDESLYKGKKMVEEDEDEDNDEDEDSNDDEQDFSKSENEDDEEDDDDDDFEKAMNAEMLAKGLFDQGKTRREVMKAMVSLGVNLKLAEITCDNCISMANNEPNNGGTITPMNFGKSEDYQMHDALEKSTQAIAKTTDLLKSLVSENESMRKQIDELTKSFDTFRMAPNQRKSVMTQKYADRFEKGDSNGVQQVYDTRNPQDMMQLSSRLFEQVQLIKSNGQSDFTLEKAVADLEITKTTNFSANSPRLSAMGIKLV